MTEHLPWVILITYIAVLLFIDFFVLHKKGALPNTRKAVLETLFFITNALLFGFVVYWLYAEGHVDNPENLSPKSSVIKYVTGYIIELSLSVDNLFVIALIFLNYKIPSQYQHRLLFLGIMGAIVFRALLISLGLILINSIQHITLVFGLFLLYTAFKMLKDQETDLPNEKRGLSRFFNISKTLDNGHFRTTINGKRVFTALFGALLTIEFTDLLFALDSIPAVLAVTTDPFIVFSSNIFAIMGLRSLYFFLANMLDRFKYLKYSVFSILLFVGFKLIVANWLEIPEWISLAFIALSLGLGIMVSLSKNNQQNKEEE